MADISFQGFIMDYDLFLQLVFFMGCYIDPIYKDYTL
jgi:hypothetical protein